MKNAWQELNDREETKLWNRFEKEFNFTPSVHSESWPGISEPTPSETYVVSKAYDGEESHYTKLITELQLWGLGSFQELLSPEPDWLYALDWQHSCYRFFPHIPFELDDYGQWTIPIFPDGDYHIFLDKSFSWGIFGHPWEQTICIFGAALLANLGKDRPELLTNLVRKNGLRVA